MSASHTPKRSHARLYAAAYTSYDKHCGPRAVECAEADLLGKALGALKHLAGLFQQLHPNHSEWGDYKAALAVLAKVPDACDLPCPICGGPRQGGHSYQDCDDELAKVKP